MIVKLVSIVAFMAICTNIPNLYAEEVAKKKYIITDAQLSCATKADTFISMILVYRYAITKICADTYSVRDLKDNIVKIIGETLLKERSFVDIAKDCLATCGDNAECQHHILEFMALSAERSYKDTLNRERCKDFY